MPRRKQFTKKVTMLDVAREAGVSHATVSRVLNQSAYVDPEKQQRVIQAMMQLGFSANQHARSLANNRSQLVGIVSDGLSASYSPYYDKPITDSVQAALEKEHYNLILYNVGTQKTHERAYFASLTRGVADGFLLLLPDNARTCITELRRQQVPYVIIDHQLIDSPGSAVRSANRQGGYDATRYLLQLGHRRIGFITGHINWGCALERLEGYKVAQTECGVPFDPALVVEGNFTTPSGYTGANTLLSLPDPPSAIFASNDGSAYGVMDAIKDRHLRIPDDISVIGFDDIVPSAETHPPLTSVRQPLEQIGRIAAKLLLDAINDPDLPETIIELPTQLIIRQSCCPPRSQAQRADC